MHVGSFFREFGYLLLDIARVVIDLLVKCFIEQVFHYLVLCVILIYRHSLILALFLSGLLLVPKESLHRIFFADIVRVVHHIGVEGLMALNLESLHIIVLASKWNKAGRLASVGSQVHHLHWRLVLRHNGILLLVGSLPVTN